MKYFEMLKLIHENNLEISFRKSSLSGIRIDVSKTVGDKRVKNSREISHIDLTYQPNNHYISEMIASILDTEKQITLQGKSSG